MWRRRGAAAVKAARQVGTEPRSSGSPGAAAGRKVVVRGDSSAPGGQRRKLSLAAGSGEMAPPAQRGTIGRMESKHLVMYIVGLST